MANGNPFYVAPPSLGGLGQIAQAWGQKRMQDQQEAQRREQQEAQKQSFGQALSLMNQAARAQDPAERERLYTEAFQANPEAVRSFQQIIRTRKETEQIGQQEKQPYQKGEGALVFDPNTNTYSIDPVAQEYLDKKAEEKLASGEKLKTSDIRGINKDLTDLTKQAKAAKTSAESIESLSKVKNPAAQVGIIFAYMKSLDPTSVVRESEQGMVASANGPMKQFASQINRIAGDGPLDDTMINQIIAAAHANSNSLINSANQQVDSYLEGFGDSIGEKNRSNFNKRKITPFKTSEPEIAKEGESEEKQSLPFVNDQGWQLMTDANGNQAYVGPDGQFEEIE